MIKAMKQLRRHYILQFGGFKTEMTRCILCEVVETTAASLSLCSKCPWVIETGNICTGAQSKWGISSLRRGIDGIPKQTKTKWQKRRIKELGEWIGE